MTIGSRLTTRRLIVATALCAAMLAGTSAVSDAAELGRFPGAKYSGARSNWNWRERCAYAGYYCLYAWRGSVYHYRWDDYPYPYAFYPRRTRSRF